MHFPPIAIFQPAFVNNMFGVDGLVVLIIGLLIFGKRLGEFGQILSKAAKDLDLRNLALCLAIVLWLIVVLYCAFYRFVSDY
jgi:hypothetical protein